MNTELKELHGKGAIFDYVAERRRRFYEDMRTRGVDLPSAQLLRGSVYKLSDSTLALDQQGADLEVDPDSRSATFTITTPREDRYGDVVVPKGCLTHLTNYLKNPQVFFSHRSTDFPIASCRDASGQVHLDVSDDKVRARAFFNEETEVARVTWSMVAKGLLRATSVGFLPVKGSVIGSNKTEEEREEEYRANRKRKTDDGEKVIDFGAWMPLRFLEWDLLEFSVVPVPANPDCVDSLSMFLSRGEIEGDKIPLSVRRALEPYALKARVWAHGFDPTKVSFTGTLKMGDSELEYKEGRLHRIDAVPLTAPSPLPPEDNKSMTAPTLPAELTRTIANCSRCALTHESLVFKALANPTGDWTHWALCPKNAEPLFVPAREADGGQDPNNPGQPDPADCSVEDVYTAVKAMHAELAAHAKEAAIHRELSATHMKEAAAHREASMAGHKSTHEKVDGVQAKLDSAHKSATDLAQEQADLEAIASTLAAVAQTNQALKAKFTALTGQRVL